MRICIVGKFPPIEGGVSHQTHLAAHELARRGHDVAVVTNAAQVEPELRALMLPGDSERLEGRYELGSVTCAPILSLPIGSFVPWAAPYASELFGRALSVIEERGCDLVVGWYLEPYGVVAAQVAATTDTPLVLRHAGSDLTRLPSHPDLRRAYAWALQRADRVLTTPSSIDRLVELGADRSGLVVLRGSRAPAYFQPDAESLDLADVRRRAAGWWEAVGVGGDPGRDPPEGSEATTIGVYGKVGEEKGSFDLLAALDELAATGLDFHLQAVVGGHRPTVGAFARRVRRSPALAARTTLVPFLAPWRIPSFLRRCDLTCFLERAFSVPTHQPRVPQEVMLVGSCLVCSREIADRPFYSETLVDRRNCLVVDDPRDTAELARTLAWALDHPDEVRALAARGRALMQSLSGVLPSRDEHADAIEAGWD